MLGRQLNFLSLLILISLTGVSACFPGQTTVSGRKIDKSTWERIVKGKTTEAEVIALLGEPQMRRVNSDGTKTYTYMYHEMNISNMAPFQLPKTESYTEHHEIVFDRRGIVSERGPPKDNP